jgi:hypothetical protein
VPSSGSCRTGTEDTVLCPQVLSSDLWRTFGDSGCPKRPGRRPLRQNQIQFSGVSDKIDRILQINQLRTVTKEVVETARESLVIGSI